MSVDAAPIRAAINSKGAAARSGQAFHKSYVSKIQDLTLRRSPQTRPSEPNCCRPNRSRLDGIPANAGPYHYPDARDASSSIPSAPWL